MAGLINSVPSTSAFKYYVGDLKDVTLKREMGKLADKLKKYRINRGGRGHRVSRKRNIQPKRTK